jgi:hypothetical protein
MKIAVFGNRPLEQGFNFHPKFEWCFIHNTIYFHLLCNDILPSEHKNDQEKTFNFFALGSGDAAIW